MNENANGVVGIRDNGVPRTWEDLRAFVIVHEGARWWLGRPWHAGWHMGVTRGGQAFAEIAVGKPAFLSPAYELADDDVWAQAGEPSAKSIPDKQLVARRRDAVPAFAFSSGYTYECIPSSIFRLDQLDENDLRLGFQKWIVRGEQARDGMREATAQMTSGIVKAPSLRGLPPPPKG